MGTHIWKTSMMNCKEYNALKKAIFNMFIHSVANHATLHTQVEIIPGEDGELTYLFLMLTEENENKCESAKYCSLAVATETTSGSTADQDFDSGKRLTSAADC
jgi:hypothetical protein